ncbi:MAG: amidohydrolase [Gemmatimonadaceae bacterium]|nr:amidohydrolase [Gemmatimonadaceae bacterium]NUO94702.1 amidohydrolase [Gemmatimonadaceae bacterium]NUP54426.1 amidohydrolase [Gemmatimonadaceae bacterium]NUR33814.1 amidohydrolase [Gemmatimonadaceae bacterium]NUS31844.1 amidohydrolase [Gemmatimonadaceae bacterium]
MALALPAAAGAQRRGDDYADSIKYRYPSTPQLDLLKAEAAREIDAKAKMIQVMVDQVFSYGELGFQEVETSKYLTGILEENGFKVERGVAGIPTAFVARWGSGKPVISLGSDIDDIPQASNKPGVGWHDPLVAGAPGHGEGHNSGMPLNIAAALVVKKIMERDRIPGTIVLWPGVAEEQMAGKAFLVRAGVFKDVDVTLFTHVGNQLAVSWGQSGNNALISAIFKFKGSSAHAAGAPWRGKSALDAVMLMANGWEFHREHMELAQRSHYVIPDGGDQPNVVPSTASIWFYFRERDYERTLKMFEDAKKMAQGATLMTDTQIDTIMMVGSGWSGHFSRPIAEAMYRNIEKVGTPVWDEKDQALARGLQRELAVADSGLSTRPGRLGGPVNEATRTGGGSDDIGDVSWTVPTITLNYPSNIPGTPGHNWANAVSMATPIAHKGVVAGAKVQAMTMLDILLTPQVVVDAWDYFTNVQTKTTKYRPFFAPTDKPPIWLNATIMEKYRPEMRKYYYDPKKYATYLEQLGITYPTVRKVVQ